MKAVDALKLVVGVPVVICGVWLFGSLAMIAVNPSLYFQDSESAQYANKAQQDLERLERNQAEFNCERGLGCSTTDTH